MLETRRDFFRVLGTGIVVTIGAEERAPAQRSEGGRRGSGEAMPSEISAWLHIGAGGAVTVYAGKAEMGQNIRTSLAQAAAEELHAPFTSISMVMGDTDLTPWDAGTFGSRTTPFLAPQIRKASAAAREILIGLAAKRWGVDPSVLRADSGRVVRSGTDQSISFGELAHGRKLVEQIPANTVVTPTAKWQVAGKPIPKVSGRQFVTGAHQYASDLKRPGMLYGKVVRPPAWNSTLVDADIKGAQAIKGVSVIRDGNFIGVAAPTPEEAERAAKAIRANWHAPQQPSGREIFDYLKAHADTGSEGAHPERGSMAAGMAAAEIKLRQTYTVAYIAHAPPEPRAAVAEWAGGKLTVWTGSQRPFGVRSDLASTLGLPEEQVRVIVLDSAGAYGGKHIGDAAIEAARIAKGAGRPVKLVWSREEEFTWAYFRPAGVIEVSSGARKDGTITAWEFHNYNSGGAGIPTPYAIPNQHIEFHPVRSPLRQGSYRALAAPANFFARESHMDELARATGIDPLEFRMKNATDPRLRGVFEAVAARFGWNSKAPKGRGFGIAGGFEKGSYVATCIEVSVARPSGAITIHRVVEAFECGAVVNPDGIKNQIEGMIMMGLGGALFEAVEFENGRILNPYFSSYRVPRFGDMPPIEVVLVDRPDLPSTGGGETPICAIAPALANAICDATGVRLRSLPLAPKGVRLA